MSRTPSDEASAPPSMTELTSLLSALQIEVVGLKSKATESDTQIASLRETVVNLTHENELLKRRIYGNKTERTQTSEAQLTLGGLLDAERELQKQLDKAVAEARSATRDTAPSDASEAPKAKPKGRRNLSESQLPRILLEIFDETLEKTAKRIGFEQSLQLMHRPASFAVLVKRIAKYEVPSPYGTSIVGVETPKTLFPRGLLHTSVVAFILVQKFALGVPHYRLEQHLAEHDAELDRGTMCRYADEAGGALGATVVHAMWQDALRHSAVISTDATSALVQPEKTKGPLREACKKGHFFTAVADCDHVLFAYTEKHSQEFVQKLFAGFRGLSPSRREQRLRHLRPRSARGQRGRHHAGRMLGPLPALLLRSGHLQIRTGRAGAHAHPRHLCCGQRVSKASAEQA